MRNLAPHLKRQRLLVEGYFAREVDQSVIRTYFEELTGALHLRTYGDPIIFSPEGLGSEANQGYDAFVPLIDSGISLYIWSESRFLSVVIYTCKEFDEDVALRFTTAHFEMAETAHTSF